MLARTLPARSHTQDAPLWPLLVFLAAVSLFWHDTLLAQLARSPEAVPRRFTPELAVWTGILTQAMFSALEAFLYARVWRVAGYKLPWARTAGALFVISSFEAFALTLLQRPDAASFVWLVGERAGWPGGIAASGLGRAFGACGLLAAVRVALTAHVQARGTRAHHAYAFAVTLAGWFCSRLALWWTTDLLRGRSHGM